MSLTIHEGGVVVKDPSDQTVITVDWDAENLSAGVTITSSAWAITALRPSADTALTKDNPNILSGLRTTQIRLIAGTLGALYQVDNTIVTSESPTQTKQRSFLVSVETR